MNLLSVDYLLLVVGSVVCFWVSPARFRPYVLVLAALAYCLYDGPTTAVMVVGSGLLAWLSGIANLRGWTNAKWLTVVAVVGPLSLVLATKILRPEVDLAELNAAQAFSFSYFAFQAIAYAVDVRRGDVTPASSPVDVVNLVSFFPHLAAGPVMAPRRMLPQLERFSRQLSAARVAEGVELVLLGLFKKVVLSGTFVELSTGVAAIGFWDRLIYGVGMVLAAYFDVTSYIDLARGVGKFFALELPVGFAQPLTRSRSITDFWRRWHIPMMAWFRTYVYRPILERAPSRYGRVLGVVAVFLATGFWHGLSTLWIAWGVVTAVLILVDEWAAGLMRRSAERWRSVIRVARRLSVPGYVFGLPITFVYWDGLSRNLNSARVATSPVSVMEMFVAVVVLAVAVLLVERYERRRAIGGESSVVVPSLARGVAWGLSLVCIVLSSAGPPSVFIYQGF